MKKKVNLFDLQPNKKYIITYKSKQSKVRKQFDGVFEKETEYVIETSDYFKNEMVQKAKEEGILGDGKSGENERMVFPFIYYNIKTGTNKLRVPVLDSKVLKYFFKHRKCTKEKYFKELEKTGFKPQSVTYLWNRFQSFNIDKIKTIKEFVE